MIKLLFKREPLGGKGLTGPMSCPSPFLNPFPPPETGQNWPLYYFTLSNARRFYMSRENLWEPFSKRVNFYSIYIYTCLLYSIQIKSVYIYHFLFPDKWLCWFSQNWSFLGDCIWSTQTPCSQFGWEKCYWWSLSHWNWTRARNDSNVSANCQGVQRHVTLATFLSSFLLPSCILIVKGTICLF